MLRGARAHPSGSDRGGRRTEAVLDPALARALERPLAAVYLVTGAESLLVERAVAALRDRVLPQVGLPAFNVAEHRGSDADVVEAIGTARTLPMMGDRRLVVVRELEAAPDAFFEALEGYVQRPSETTTLILGGAGFPKVVKGGRNWSRLGKVIEGVGVVLKYGEGAVNPVAFAREHARALGHELGADEARLLVELAGSELARVAREVEKVALFVDEGAPLDADAIGTACSALAEKEAWDLTTGIAARDPEAALGALHRLLEQGDAPHKLLGLVGWQLRNVLRVSELVRQRAPEDHIQREVRLRPEVYRKVRRVVEQRSPAAADVLERLARANRAMNSARAGDRRVLEQLVLELARP